MSVEEELAELSLVYHGQRERMQELEILLKDYHDFLSRTALDLTDTSRMQMIITTRDSLLRRTEELLEKKEQSNGS